MTRRQIDYRVIKSNNITTLSNAVRSSISDSWEATGGAYAIIDSYKNDVLMQVIVRYKNDTQG